MALEAQIKVYSGGMFSAKTSSLVIDYERLVRGNFNIRSYNHWIDRERKGENPAIYGDPEIGDIVTHNGAKIPAKYLGSREQRDLRILESTLLLEDIEQENAMLSEKGQKVDVVFLNEAQFCDSGITAVLKKLRDQYGIYVVVSTLDQDFRKEPFPHWDDPDKNIGALLAVADKVVKTKATCTYRMEDGRICGRKAATSMRTIADQRTEVAGGAMVYKAACHNHHKIPE